MFGAQTLDRRFKSYYRLYLGERQKDELEENPLTAQPGEQATTSINASGVSVLNRSVLNRLWR